MNGSRCAHASSRSHTPPLSSHEAALIARWIEQGATFKRHWSLLPIEQPFLPEVPDSSRDVYVVERERTSSALQALVLLNDPQLVEAARMLGQRMIVEHGTNAHDIIGPLSDSLSFVASSPLR